MTPALSHFLIGLFFFVLSGFFAVLHSAYRLSGEAGVRRFVEKYPAAARYDFWTSRWPFLSASLLIVWLTLAVLGVEFMLPLGKGLLPSFTILRLVGIVFLLILSVHILPIAWAESYADRLTSATLPATVVLTALIYPVSAFIATLERGLMRLFLSRSNDENRPSSEDEIISLVDHIDADDLEDSERAMIHSILEFGDTCAREIMAHRVNTVAFEQGDSIADCVRRSRDSSYSRFPVYANHLDDIRGVVHVKDLLRALSDGQGDQPVASLCNTVTFVPETMPIDDLFHLLRSARAQLAVVVDEYGGTAGLVSMEDIIEELVGEIHDEYDIADTHIQPMPDGTCLVDARMAVDEINEQLKTNLPESDDYDSIGGLIFHLLGRIPGTGEVIHSENVDMRIHTASPNRIHTIRLTPPPVPDGSD